MPCQGRAQRPKATVPVGSVWVFVMCGTLVHNKPEDYNLKRDECQLTPPNTTRRLAVLASLAIGGWAVRSM